MVGCAITGASEVCAQEAPTGYRAEGEAPSNEVRIAVNPPEDEGELRLYLNRGVRRRVITDQTAASSERVLGNLELVCRAPCVLEIARGTHRFALMSPHATAPIANEWLSIEHDGQIRLDFQSKESDRELGAGLVLTSILGGLTATVVFAIVALAANDGGDRSLERGALIGLGTSVGLGVLGTSVGLLFAFEEDQGSISFVPRGVH